MRFEILITVFLGLLFFSSVSAATFLFPGGGGTGTSTAPAYGDILVGNSNGTYNLVATSSLGEFGFLTGSTTLADGSIGIATTTPPSIFTVVGHAQFSATSSPSLSSCGTTPTVSGSDMAGKLVVGSGVISSCTINFDVPFVNPPACIANDETAILLVRAVSTPTAVTLSVATTFQGDTVSYICLGY